VAGEIHIGCSGWVYPSWRGVLYPPGLAQTHWLARYAELFDTVEVNSTFYRLASPPAVERWVEATPPHFRFTVKASRYLTHITHLQKFEPGVRRFSDSIDPLVESKKLEAVLWQLPPTQQRNDEMLDGALAKLPPGRHAFEFRHPSWFADEVYALLRRYDAALVIADRPEVKEFQAHVLTTSWTLVRFHYGARGRRGNYSETELQDWAERLRDWSSEAEVFAYFNNDWEVFAVRNALRLKQLLAL
jgi:uncharacterized protein YecE (DUF72 family)